MGSPLIPSDVMPLPQHSLRKVEVALTEQLDGCEWYGL